MGVLAKAMDRFFGGSSTTLANPAPWFQESLIGVKTATGRVVGPEQALRASAVLACIRILTEGIATLPLILYRQKPSGDKVHGTQHPLYSILKSIPNEEMTSFELIEAMILYVLSHGTSFNQVVRVAGSVSEIYPLNSSFVTAGRNASGRLYFDYSDPETSEQRQFWAEDIWRVNMLSSGMVLGRSMMLLCREAIGLALAAEEQGARLFSNGAQIAGIIEAPATVKFKDDEERNDLLDSFNQIYGGTGNSFKTALFEGGLKYSKIGLTAQESQYIDARKFQLAEIARDFRIFPTLLGMEEKTASYASVEQFLLAHSKFTLTPWCVRIEQTGIRDLLLPSERGRYFMKFNMAALERGDIKTRYEAYGTAIKDGWMARAEAREKEDLNHEDGLEKFLVPLNYGIQLEDGTILNPNSKGDSKSGSTSSPAPPPEDPGEDASERFRRLAEASAERAVRREVGAVRKLLAKRKEDTEILQFHADAITFYNEHAAWLQKALRLSPAEAASYCTEHLKALQACAVLTGAQDKLDSWDETADIVLADLAMGKQ